MVIEVPSYEEDKGLEFYSMDVAGESLSANLPWQIFSV
jgi:hypothetical protein